MSATVRPWLNAFISQELLTVLSWQQHIRSKSKVKDDPEYERFQRVSHEHFRIDVAASSSQQTSYLQVVEIINKKPNVTLLLEDGERSIEALVPPEVVQSYEEQIDGDIEFATGDIVHLKHYTINDTPYGPGHEQLQLAIHELQHVRIQRKLLGAYAPIEKSVDIKACHAKFVLLCDDPTAFDKLTLSPPAQHDPQPSISTIPSTAVQAKQQQIAKGTAHTISTQKPEEAVDTSIISENMATQVYEISRSEHRARPSKKRKPSLGQDGIEFSTGDNLTGPLAAGYSKQLKRDTVRSDDKLLTLLKHKDRPPASQIIEPAPLQPKAVDMPNASTVMNKPAPQPQITAEHETTSQRLRQRNLDIPRDQQELLALKESWYPPPPDKAFPIPNLPAALLAAWSAKMVASQDDPMDVDEPLTSKTPAVSILAASSSGSSDASSESGEDAEHEAGTDEDDEMLIPEWSQSPERRPELPPDSSGMVPSAQIPPKVDGRPSTSSSLEEAVPRAVSVGIKEQHRMDRRKQFQRGQREQWLRSVYAGPDAKEFDPQEASTAYREKYANDDVSEVEMKELFIEKIAKSWSRSTRQENPAKPTKDHVQQMNVPAEPSSPVIRDSGEPEHGPAAQRDEGAEDEGSKVTQDSSTDVINDSAEIEVTLTITERAAEEAPQPSHVTIASTEAEQPTDKTNVLPDRTIEQSSPQPVRSSGAQPQWLTKEDVVRANNILLEESTSRVPATIPREQQLSEKQYMPQTRKLQPMLKASSAVAALNTTQEAPLTELDRFARAWREMRPGGAWTDSRKIKPLRKQKTMDVLSW